MSLTHLVADAIAADREREFRARSHGVPGLGSGPRHPNEQESRGLPEPRPSTTSKPITRPRVAWGG